MRVLVTGASGLVGSAVARRLSADGHTVVGLGRRPAPEGLVHEHVQADLGADSPLAQQVAPCELIVHTAASMAWDPLGCSLSHVNGAGTQRVLALARGWGARHLVYISSIGVVGRPQRLPITEDDPPRPATAYHASKLYGEQLCRLTLGDDATALRISSPLGPGLPRERLASRFVENAVAGRPLVIEGRGTRAQNFIDVRDIADAVALALERRTGGVLNVAGACVVTTEQLARLCIDCLDSRSKIVFSGRPDPEDDLSWQISIERATDALGWSPRVELSRTLGDLAAWLSPPRP